MSSQRLVQVAPERNIDRYPTGLTYLVPDRLTDLVHVGQRVWAPLGRGAKGGSIVAGIITAVNFGPQAQSGTFPSIPEGVKIREIARLAESDETLTDELIDLARWMSRYYFTPLGMVLSTIVPAAVRKGTGRKRTVLIDLPEQQALAPQGGTVPEIFKPHRRSPAQNRLLQALADLGPDALPVAQNELLERAGVKSSVPIRALARAGLILEIKASSVHATWDEADWNIAGGVGEVRPELTPAQSAIIRHLATALDAGKFAAHVLYGITGSGKTEVYLNLIEHMINTDSSGTAIVLVPEISLTPQTLRRFKARLGDLVAVLHSGLTGAQRHEQWQTVRQGKARIVVGARSAIFAPVLPASLRLIIVDEEHDSSYKQDQALRYHARDLAVRRAQMNHALAILGSATPSLESYWNAMDRQPVDRRYCWHELIERVPGSSLPKVTVVDLKKELREMASSGERGIRLIGPTLGRALVDTLQRGGQAILLLNRRGYASYIACPDHRCGWIMTCDHCDAAMVYHKDHTLPLGGLVRCHHCLSEQVLPRLCPTCGKRIAPFGMGTQRIEEELERVFGSVIAPDEIIRMDSDAMQKGSDYLAALNAFGEGRAKILVGTQMVSLGLDYPNVRLVGVVQADTAIHLPDFRSAERTFQLISQVAGRAGRGVEPGRVVIQTFVPNHYAVRFAAQHDYRSFAQHEQSIRKEARLPPVSRMIRIVFRDRDFEKVQNLARQAGLALTGIIERRHPEQSVILRGPAPCPLSRIADEYRFGIELIGPTHRVLEEVLDELLSAGVVKAGAHTAIDVDPVNLL